MTRVAILRTGRSHKERKQLFQRGLRRGFLTIQEIETALPPGSLTAAERWLLYYSLRAAEVEIRDESGQLVTVPALAPEELEELSRERAARAAGGGPEAPPSAPAGSEEPGRVGGNGVDEGLGGLEAPPGPEPH